MRGHGLLGAAVVLAAAVVLIVSQRPGVLQAAGPIRPDAEVSALLDKAASYLDGYQKNFSAVVAQEIYLQTSTGRTSRRELRSDLMEMNLDEAQWTQFRDVYEVDGKKVRDHDARLESLFLKPTVTMLSEATRIANESARYNLGVQRTINVPTMALTYLMRPFQFRSLFEASTPDVIGDRPVIALSFREVFFPTLIRDKVIGDVPSRGRFWIDPSTGDVLRTELHCRVPQKDGSLVGTTTVTYTREPTLKLLVPATMDEEWTRGRDIDRGHATYSNFRLFTVDTVAIKRGGGG